MLLLWVFDSKMLCFLCVCMLIHFRLVQLFAMLWTVASQAPVRGILQAKILEWIVMSSSRGSFQLRDQTCKSYVSCTARQVLTVSATWETLCLLPASIKPQVTSLLADKEGRLSVPLQFFFKYCRYQLYFIYYFGCRAYRILVPLTSDRACAPYNGSTVLTMEPPGSPPFHSSWQPLRNPGKSRNYESTEARILGEGAGESEKKQLWQDSPRLWVVPFGLGRFFLTSTFLSSKITLYQEGPRFPFSLGKS